MKTNLIKMFAVIMAFLVSQGIMAQSQLLFQEDFDKSLGDFTVEGYNGMDPESPIWYNLMGCAKADGYGKFDDEEIPFLENFFVSPVIKLGTSDNTVNFDYIFIDYLEKGTEDQLAFCIREVNGEWEELSVPVFAAAKKYTSSGDIIIPDMYNEKDVQFGFKYMSEGNETSPLFKIDFVKVMGVGGSTFQQDPNISFSKEEAYAIVGQDFEEPILANPNGVEIIFSSENPAVATVDAQTGEVTAVAEGTTAIYATSVESESFKSAVVGYLLKVNEAVEGTVIFSESFTSGIGSFTIEGFNGDNDDIWAFAGEGMVADAYGKVEADPTTVYLVSPEIALGTNNTVSYDYRAFFFAEDVLKEEMAFVVREIGGEWEQLEIPNLFLPGDFASSGYIFIPESYNNKTVQVAFRYSTKSSASSGSWTVRNLEVRSAGASEKKDPQISFPQDEYVYVIGTGDFNAPVVNNPNNVEVVYSSSNTEMADVDAASGFVMMYDLGSVEIIATSVETEEFKSVSVSYTLIITDTPPTGIDGIFADDLKNGKVFDIQGRRVDNIGKGLYIINGKKVVIK